MRCLAARRLLLLPTTTWRVAARLWRLRIKQAVACTPSLQANAPKRHLSAEHKQRLGEAQRRRWQQWYEAHGRRWGLQPGCAVVDWPLAQHCSLKSQRKACTALLELGANEHQYMAMPAARHSHETSTRLTAGAYQPGAPILGAPASFLGAASRPVIVIMRDKHFCH